MKNILLMFCVLSLNIVWAQQLKLHKGSFNKMKSFYQESGYTSAFAEQYNMSSQQLDQIGYEVVAFSSLHPASKVTYLQKVGKQLVQKGQLKNGELQTIIKLQKAVNQSDVSKAAQEIARFLQINQRSAIGTTIIKYWDHYAKEQGYNSMSGMSGQEGFPDIPPPEVYGPTGGEAPPDLPGFGTIPDPPENNPFGGPILTGGIFTSPGGLGGGLGPNMATGGSGGGGEGGSNGGGGGSGPTDEEILDILAGAIIAVGTAGGTVAGAGVGILLGGPAGGALGAGIGGTVGGAGATVAAAAMYVGAYALSKSGGFVDPCWGNPDCPPGVSGF